MEKDEPMTPRILLAMIMAHIDERLLMEADKETDKNKLFTVIEIREQMENSMVEILKGLEEGNYDTDRRLPLRIFSDN